MFDDVFCGAVQVTCYLTLAINRNNRILVQVKQSFTFTSKFSKDGFR